MEAKHYIKIRFYQIPQENRELLIAKVNMENITGLEEVGTQEILVYFDEGECDIQKMENIAKEFSAEMSHEKVIEENWNAAWEASITPIDVEHFCRIRASFHEASDQVKYDLIITPRMSFGTGHHATTYQVIQGMRAVDFSGKKVLDFGTGTGVLGILAYKMGAKEVLGIDNDIWSIDNAKENVEENQAEMILKQGSLEQAEGKMFDVILANINLHILKTYAKDMYSQLLEGGDLLISGILETDIEELSEDFKSYGFRLKQHTVRDNWVMMHWQK